MAQTHYSTDELARCAIERGEAKRAEGGALVVATGRHTGRSPKDKFILRDKTTENTVWWANNQAISPHHFAVLKADFLAHAKARELFTEDLQAGADPSCRLNVRVVCERAWHALFIRHLLRQPQGAAAAGHAPELTIIDLPSFRADPERHGTRSESVIACDFTSGLVLIGGTEYAGEIKKAVFTALNYALPDKGVLPMHCAANIASEGDSALFFGLSGTGKTTLSADPSRVLIGDDEHGWSPDGIYNFEGGCYAKVIRLSAAAEPQIFAAAQRQNTILENVVIDAKGRMDFDDSSLTENTRAAYPLNYIDNSSPTGRAGHPRHIVMLTADAFGVLPPIARLTPAQAIYYFLSGYTAKVAGTERGVTEPEATFSTCFGAPFLPRNPHVYASLLKDLLSRHKTDCWLVNTGWTSGAYGTGHRMPIAATRALLGAALDGKLDRAPMRIDPWFGAQVPVMVPGVDQRLLDPRATWGDAAAYDRQAKRLVGLFIENFARFEAEAGADVRAAAPAAA